MLKSKKNTKLKECPMCGSKAELRSDFGKAREKAKSCQIAYVRCTNRDCLTEGCIVDSCCGEKEQDAIDKWNRRV